MRNTPLIFKIFFALIFGSQAAAAQFPIKIPQIPKPKVEKASSNTTTANPTTSQKDFPRTPTPSSGEDQPSISKDSVQIRAFTFSNYRKDYNVWSWVPAIEYRVNGPTASGSQLYVEVSLPSGGAWLKFDCKTEAVRSGGEFKTECGGREIPEDKGIIATGSVNFAIKLRNELAGTDMSLFSGKMKVAKVRSNEVGPKFVNHFVYYVDHDWNLPIGYLFYEGDYQWDADRPERWAKPKFSFAFWMKGETSGFAEPHIFYGGKEVGKLYYNDREVGSPSCSVTEVQNNPTHITNPEGLFKWTRWKCTFSNVLPWNRSSDKNETMFGRLFLFNENPGEYEMKIMHNGRLIRTFKFAVDREGKLVDNGIARSNKLGSDRVIVPVQILGDQDGAWDKIAWKTDAFYGNPLTGFNVP